MYRIYHPILKFYQMLRVVPRHNPIREIFHNPIRNSYRMIRTIPSVIPAYPTSVQTSTCKPGSLRKPSRTHQFKSSHPPKALYDTWPGGGLGDRQMWLHHIWRLMMSYLSLLVWPSRAMLLMTSSPYCLSYCIIFGSSAIYSATTTYTSSTFSSE